MKLQEALMKPQNYLELTFEEVKDKCIEESTKDHCLMLWGGCLREDVIDELIYNGIYVSYDKIENSTFLDWSEKGRHTADLILSAKTTQRNIDNMMNLHKGNDESILSKIKSFFK